MVSGAPKLMFITHQSSKSQFSEMLGGAALALWNEVELSLQAPWFLVNVRQTEPMASKAFETTRTLLLPNLQALEQVALQQTTEGQTKLVSIHIVTPGYLNGSDEWRMDQLRAVWSAEDPKEPGNNIDVYETLSGEKFSAATPGTAIDSLKIGPIRFRSPSETESAALD